MALYLYWKYFLFKSNICTYCRASVSCKCHHGEERQQWQLLLRWVYSVGGYMACFCYYCYCYFSLIFSVAGSLFLSRGKICKGLVKEMFVNIMCKAERNGSCMLNRLDFYQANQLTLTKWENVVRAQTPGTKTHSPSLTSSLLIFLSALTWLNQEYSKLCIWNHLNQSSTLFVSLSTFSLAETHKGSPNPAANVLLLDG